jgi:superfamily II DNA or RNA helicase
MTQLAQQPDNESRLILATGRYPGEGFDDPRLNTLLLTMPMAWKGTVVQYTGRLHRPHEYVDCPVRVWLDRPLGERAVIDVDDDEELPLYVPEYLNNVVQPDHGYHPANRRRRRPEGLDDTDDVDPSSRRGHRLLG